MNFSEIYPEIIQALDETHTLLKRLWEDFKFISELENKFLRNPDDSHIFPEYWVSHWLFLLALRDECEARQKVVESYQLNVPSKLLSSSELGEQTSLDLPIGVLNILQDTASLKEFQRSIWTKYESWISTLEEYLDDAESYRENLAIWYNTPL